MSTNKKLIVAIYENGTAINLAGNATLPASEPIFFIRGIYDKSTTSGQNEYYKYSLHDSNFELIANNHFAWKTFKITISNRDGWLQPLPDWSGNHNFEIRLGIKIETQDNKSVSLNFLHWNHDGIAFKDLFYLLGRIESMGLAEAVSEFRKSNR